MTRIMLSFNTYIGAFVLLIMVYGSFIGQSKAENTCATEDYSPCTCQGVELDSRNFILCNLVDVAAVMDIFKRTQTVDIAELKFYKKWSDIFIPDHFISNKKMGKLVLDCGTDPDTTIGKDSFNSTRLATSTVELYRCILHDSDLSFIEGFTKMTTLLLEKFKEIGKLFSTFPINLPTLNSIKFNQCFGWNTLINAPSPIVGANKFFRLDLVNSVDMTDDVMNMVIEWAVQSFNATLSSLYIQSNNLTKIPSKLEFFGQIGTLNIKNNFFPHILAGSLKFTSNEIIFIDISNCGVQDIEANAFEGIFETTFIDFSNNYLSRLDSSVFEEILLSGGTIDVSKNPLDCVEDPCHLSWIFNQNLLKSVLNAVCSNGTLFEDLNPNFFADCLIVSTLESFTPTFTTQETAEFTSNMYYMSTGISSRSTFSQTSQSLATTYYTSANESTLLSTIVPTISLSAEQSKYQPTSFATTTPNPTSYQGLTTTSAAQELHWHTMVLTTVLLSYFLV